MSYTNLPDSNFTEINNCDICNKLGLCRLYQGEKLCKVCHADAGKIALELGRTDGREILTVLRYMFEKGIPISHSFLKEVKRNRMKGL